MKRLHYVAAALTAALSLAAIPAAHAFPPSYTSIDGNASLGLFDVEGLNSTDLNLDGGWPGTDIDCSSPIEFEGRIARGAIVVPGSKIGVIDSFEAANCLASTGMFPVRMMGVGSWEVHANDSPAAPGVPFEVSIQDVDLYVHSSGGTPMPCEFSASADEVLATFVPGAGATDGWIEFDTPVSPMPAPLLATTFDGSGTFTPSPAGVGCGGMIYDGDAFSMIGNFALSTVGQTPGAISHG